MGGAVPSRGWGHGPGACRTEPRGPGGAAAAPPRARLGGPGTVCPVSEVCRVRGAGVLCVDHRRGAASGGGGERGGGGGGGGGVGKAQRAGCFAVDGDYESGAGGGGEADNAEIVGRAGRLYFLRGVHRGGDGKECERK